MSLCTVAVELASAAYLWRQNRDIYDRKCAVCLLSLVSMESLQGLLWFFVLSMPDPAERSHLNVLLSLGLMVATYVFVPLGLGAAFNDERQVRFSVEQEESCSAAPADDEAEAETTTASASSGEIERMCVKEDRLDRALRWHRRKMLAFYCFLVVQFAVELLLQGYTNQWITRVGPNGHQVWTCAQALGDAWVGNSVTAGALFDTNTDALVHHQAHRFLPCLIWCAMYSTAMACALCFGEGVRIIEKTVITLWMVTSFAVFYGWLGPSLEACSTWCWFTAGAAAASVARPFALKLLGLPLALEGRLAGEMD